MALQCGYNLPFLLQQLPGRLSASAEPLQAPKHSAVLRSLQWLAGSQELAGKLLLSGAPLQVSPRTYVLLAIPYAIASERIIVSPWR